MLFDRKCVRWSELCNYETDQMIVSLWNQTTRCTFTRVLWSWRQIIRNLCRLGQLIRPLHQHTHPTKKKRFQHFFPNVHGLYKSLNLPRPIFKTNACCSHFYNSSNRNLLSLPSKSTPFSKPIHWVIKSPQLYPPSPALTFILKLLVYYIKACRIELSMFCNEPFIAIEYGKTQTRFLALWFRKLRKKLH